MSSGQADLRVEQGRDRLNWGLILGVVLSIEFWIALSAFLVGHA
jgi:hypothetical protein